MAFDDRDNRKCLGNVNKLGSVLYFLIKKLDAN